MTFNPLVCNSSTSPRLHSCSSCPGTHLLSRSDSLRLALRSRITQGPWRQIARTGGRARLRPLTVSRQPPVRLLGFPGMPSTARDNGTAGVPGIAPLVRVVTSTEAAVAIYGPRQAARPRGMFRSPWQCGCHGAGQGRVQAAPRRRDLAVRAGSGSQATVRTNLHSGGPDQRVISPQ